MRRKVFVGMSGGVDSSVAAALLKKAGYEVAGVFIKSWDEAPASGQTCAWREERRDGLRVAARLDIPLVTLDLTAEYKKTVIDYLVTEYRAGRTPNPDVECNRTIKFGAFLFWALEHGADYIATGHYAKRSGAVLLMAKDKNKDQTYFLWTLTQAQLAHCLFPIGEYTKPEVRHLAKKFRLPTAEKKDSQGLCFVGQVDFKKFLAKFIQPAPGDVLDEQGKIIGQHRGAAFYTIGERRGFKIKAGGPCYVIAKDIKKNILVVSAKPPAVNADSKKGIILTGVNWISGQEPSADKIYLARIRHRGELTSCRLESSEKTVRVQPQKKMIAVAPGQSLVLYDGEECLGGGVIDKVRAQD